MKPSRSNSDIAYLLAQIILVIVAFVFFSMLCGAGSSPLFVGLPVMATGVIALIGLVFFVKGRKEPRSRKTRFAFIVHASIVLLFVSLIIANLIDTVSVLREF